MTNYEPSFFVGKYFNVFPAVVSVFTIPNERLRLVLRRHWMFAVTGYSDTELTAINTTTHHNLTISLDEIASCADEGNGLPSHLNPLALRLTSQVCWDHTRLWRQSLHSFSDLGPRDRLLVSRRRTVH
ncbi:MAG: hypothetical protein WDN01_16760 [Rhizomicrobium sp.]